MGVIELMRYLTSLDGPHMSVRSLSPYVGMPHPRVAAYIRGDVIPTKKTLRQLEKGMRELLAEIAREGKKWLS